MKKEENNVGIFGKTIKEYINRITDLETKNIELSNEIQKLKSSKDKNIVGDDLIGDDLLKKIVRHASITLLVDEYSGEFNKFELNLNNCVLTESEANELKMLINNDISNDISIKIASTVVSAEKYPTWAKPWITNSDISNSVIGINDKIKTYDTYVADKYNDIISDLNNVTKDYYGLGVTENGSIIYKEY